MFIFKLWDRVKSDAKKEALNKKRGGPGGVRSVEFQQMNEETGHMEKTGVPSLVVSLYFFCVIVA